MLIDTAPNTKSTIENAARPLENSLFSQSPIAQIIIDPINDKIISANDSAADFFWSTPGTFAQNKLSVFFAGIFAELINFTQSVIEQGEAWSSDLFIRSEDGQHTKNVEINAFLLESPGHHDQPFISLFFQDKDALDKRREASAANSHYLSGISQWRRVEKFFQEIERDNQLILSAAGEGIYGVDSQGRTTFVNPVAEELLGWTAEELSGKEIHNVIHHSHQDGCQYEKEKCPIYAAFCDGVIHRVTDDIFWRKDGSYIPVEYTSTPIKDNGYLVGAVVVFRDVTEQKKAQQELLAALNQVETLKQKLEQENAYLQEEINADYNHQKIVGKSPAAQNILRQIDMVSTTDATVLITGESGTGKELIARALHESSERSNRPLIRVNCAAVPRDLFESEFFGHVKGAFTGAIKDRLGRFELADGGTIFLDEVGEIPLELQSKLLRVLQEMQFERVGDNKTRTVDIRVIAATNQDLKALVDQKLFREDLYFRLNVFPIESAPLRHRMSDIPLLAMHFLAKTSKKFNRPNLKISVSQMDHLTTYHWPGNIRELENVIERQVIVSKNDHIIFNGLFNDEINEQNNTAEDTQASNNYDAINTEPQRKLKEKEDIISALKAARGKVFGNNGAAEILGLKPTTLASRIKKYNINAREYKSANA